MKISQFQSGNFQSINAFNYQYFLPNDINRLFEIDNSALQIQLEKSTRLLGELNAMARMVPNIDLFIMSFINNEATQSSKIEGTQTAIEDSFKKESDIKIEQKDDWIEVNLYIDAITKAIDKLDITPISTRLIKKIHKTLLSSGRGVNKMPGEFRTSQNWIGGNSINTADFIPPHHDFVNKLMGDLESFLHGEHLVPDIIKIAIIHYQFETIHPFLDGNGRVGRILIPLYLVSNNLLSKPLLYMSAFFEANKNQYYQQLMKVRMDSDLLGWLLFFLGGVEQTARHSIKVLNDVLDLKSNLTQTIRDNTGNRVNNNLKLLEKLFQMPFVNVEDVRVQLKVSIATAKNVVDDLTKVGILKELTKNKRNRIFAFNPYLQLLKEPFPTEQ